MYYKLKKEYTHHGGTESKLTNLPKGTLLCKTSVTGSRFYVTISKEDSFTDFYILSEIVEGFPEFFEELEKQTFEKEISRIEILRTFLDLKDEGFSYLELKEILDEVFDINPYLSISSPNWKNPYGIDRSTFWCSCGNDGTKPCLSTACPKQMAITYTDNPSTGSLWTTTTTYQMKKEECK